MRFASHETESYDEFNDRYQLFFDQAPDLFELQVRSFIQRRELHPTWDEAGCTAKKNRAGESGREARQEQEKTERKASS